MKKPKTGNYSHFDPLIDSRVQPRGCIPFERHQRQVLAQAECDVQPIAKVRALSTHENRAEMSESFSPIVDTECYSKSVPTLLNGF